MRGIAPAIAARRMESMPKSFVLDIRMRSLLTELEEAEQLRRTVLDKGDSLEDLDMTIRRLHEDLGTALVASIERSRSGGLGEAALDTDNLPFFDADDLRDQTTEIPDPDRLREPLPFPVAEHHPKDAHFVTLESMDERKIADRERVFAEIQTDSAVSTWNRQLRQFLAVLAVDGRPKKQSEQLGWASEQLPVRLEGMPVDVQICIVGWLGAWAQHVRATLDDDVDIRLALDRLERYRVSAELPQVSALRPTPIPERGGWSQDAAAWREYLG